MSNLISIKGVRGYIDNDGTAQLNLEDISKGLGFTTVATSGNECIRWSRVEEYLKSFGFSQEVGKETFIPENIFYRLAMKARNDIAEKFQAKVADEILPSIRKTGGYVANDEMFINTYLPYADDTTKSLFRSTLQVVKNQNETILKQQKEIEHKEDVIINLIDEVELAEKRQVLNRVVRYNNANFQERWRELYKQFEMKYHIDLKLRFDSYNKSHKPKMSNKLDYVDKIMGKLPELYEIACKLYENDIKELTDEIYKLNK
ncbi:MAG: transporter [Bacillota bacterium]|nr:transporter [Bacillota bacterium]